MISAALLLAVACTPEHAAMGHCKMPAKAAPKPPVQAKPKPKPKPKAQPKPPAAASKPPAAQSCTPEHAAMGHCTMPSTPVAAPVPAHGPSGTDLPAGNAPPPPAPTADAADRVWGAAAMGHSRHDMYHMHGGMTFAQVMIDRAEVQVLDGRDGYGWSGEAWFGGDRDRLVVKSEGEGAFGRSLADAEVQALYSRAIGPYFNLQAGVRHDIVPNPSRTHLALGVEGLAPYWFEVEATAFLSDRGKLSGRVEAYYDQRITQRLILQPRAELNVGRGDAELELGLRLRYEIAREFAPYVGVNLEHGNAGMVFGVRAWF